MAALLAGLLLLTSGVGVPRPAVADQPSGVATLRHRQVIAERAMRRADRQIARIERQRGSQARRFHDAARRLQRAIERRDGFRERRQEARLRLSVARDDRDRQLRVHPSPTGRQLGDKAHLRTRVRLLEARIDRLEARAGQWGRTVERARDAKQDRARHSGHARIGARKDARERIEDVLGSRITQMMAISKERAASRFAPSSTRHFLRPARGHLSQGYGCQARRHGRCLRFHDGLDIAAPVGTRVRAAAEGYVAYVGWNPWDGGRRAYVVIVGHARSIETIYAHLRPLRTVRAGQLVRRGQVIGRIGLTGHTSGPHVHWEVSRDFRSMDPRRG